MVWHVKVKNAVCYSTEYAIYNLLIVNSTSSLLSLRYKAVYGRPVTEYDTILYWGLDQAEIQETRAKFWSENWEDETIFEAQAYSGSNI